MGTLYSKLRLTEVWLAALMLALVVGLVFWATVTRVLGVPNIWVIEVTQILFAWACLLSASVAYRSSTLFSVNIFASWLPQRYLGALRIVQATLILGMVTWLGIVALDFVELAARRPLPLTGVPFSWVALTIPVACVMMALTSLETILLTIRGSTTREKSA